MKKPSKKGVFKNLAKTAKTANFLVFGRGGTSWPTLFGPKPRKTLHKCQNPYYPLMLCINPKTGVFWTFLRFFEKTLFFTKIPN